MKKGSVEWWVMATLIGANATIDDIERSKHTKIKWTYHGQKRLITVPSSASDHRAVKNAVAQVKRDMREIDLGPRSEDA